MQTTIAGAVYTDLDKWFKQFKPVKNKIQQDARFDGCMFETYDKELQEVQKSDPHTVWSVITDDNENECVTAGMHVINLVGYLITKKKWKDGEDWNIYDSDTLDEMKRIEARQSGYTVERKVPAITQGTERYDYGKGDRRNRPCDTPLLLLWHDEKKAYVLAYKEDGDVMLFVNEYYDTPQQAVDHAWTAFGAKVVNTEVTDWEFDEEDEDF